ncbi:MAG: RNA polymerase sigma factor [Pseudonocardiaceae bacterium]
MTTATISDVSADATDIATDLLRRIGERDPAVWDEILRRYGKFVSATVQTFGLQEADALDAMQMTWMRLAENADRVQFPERLSGWLATTARRECLRILRQAKLGPHLTDVTSKAVSDPSAGPEQHAINADITRTLQKFIDELPPLQRTLIRLLFTDNPCSYGKLSRIVGIPLGGIGPTRARALQQLRDKFNEHETNPGA